MLRKKSGLGAGALAGCLAFRGAQALGPAAQLADGVPARRVAGDGADRGFPPRALHHHAVTLFVLALLVWIIIRYNQRANPVPSKVTTTRCWKWPGPSCR
jgi:hypothetical protein